MLCQLGDALNHGVGQALGPQGLYHLLEAGVPLDFVHLGLQLLVRQQPALLIPGFPFVQQLLRVEGPGCQGLRVLPQPVFVSVV